MQVCSSRIYEVVDGIYLGEGHYMYVRYKEIPRAWIEPNLVNWDALKWGVFSL